jgi:hypothetical protein
LVELLVVMAIIIIMVGLGVAAFKGGNGSDGTKGAAFVASGVFSEARNQAIMQQTLARVVVDTAWSATRTDLASHYLRRVTVAYLNPQGVQANGQVDPTNFANWLPADSWAILPGNNYFDTNFSSVDGLMPISFGGPGAPTGMGSPYYAYYQFGANGQLQAATLQLVSPPNTATTVTSTSQLPQFIVSPGRVDSAGNFQERSSANRKSSCYGFAVFPMGNMTFFQNISDLVQPTGS